LICSTWKPGASRTASTCRAQAAPRRRGPTTAAARAAAERFATYRRYWGLSAGDGPGRGAGAPTPTAATRRASRSTATAHLNRLARLGPRTGPAPGFWKNLLQAAGPIVASRRWAATASAASTSTRDWVGRDMVGIDAGAAVLALDNFLAAGRVRRRLPRPAVRGRGTAARGLRPHAGGEALRRRPESPEPLEILFISAKSSITSADHPPPASL